MVHELAVLESDGPCIWQLLPRLSFYSRRHCHVKQTSAGDAITAQIYSKLCRPKWLLSSLKLLIYAKNVDVKWAICQLACDPSRHLCLLSKHLPLSWCLLFISHKLHKFSCFNFSAICAIFISVYYCQSQCLMTRNDPHNPA